MVITEAELGADAYADRRVSPPHASPDQVVRLRDVSLSRSDRSWAIGTHLAMIPAVWMLQLLAPLVAVPIYFFVRDRSPWLQDHGREAVNLSITGAIMSFLWIVPILGWLAMLIWLMAATVGCVRGAMAADRSEYFRYPMVFRFV